MPSSLKIKQADVEKDLGNEAYKKKQFQIALDHYDKAIKLNPNEITYYTNKGAVYLEWEKYNDCIIVCFEAITVGTENRATPNQISKAWARIGNAYLKLNKNGDAMKHFKKALDVNDDPKIREQVNQLFRSMEAEKTDKENGDEYYRKEEYAIAIKYYNEAIKKETDNGQLAKLYSNRAQCFSKLKEYLLALADAEECIKCDRDFIKGHVRKGYACMELKEFSRAITAFENALKINKDDENALSGYQDACAGYYANPVEIRKRALEDPELREIIADPEVRMVLENIIQDSSQAASAIRSNNIGPKLEKLVAAGILQLA